MILPFLRRMNKESLYYSAENNFEKLANDWFSKQSWTEGHAKTVRSRMDNYILPWMGKIAIKDITAPDVLSICRRVVVLLKQPIASKAFVLKYCAIVSL